MPSPITAEQPPLTKVLVNNVTIPSGGEHRALPNLDVKNYDRLHIHIGRNATSVGGISVRVLFATPMQGLHCNAILADSTVWFEQSSQLREFSYTCPVNFGETGFIVSVPVVAPVLYDVILRNTGPQPLDTVYVTLFAQEI
jgi:hypothetical protein